MSNSIFDWFGLIAANAWLYGGAFVLVLSVLVFIHEWGHYIVARICGVKIESFSIGFGRELFGVTDKRGTRWKFSLVPLGGYVKMFGDTDPASAQHINGVVEGEGQEIRPLTDQEKSVAFFAKPVGPRAAIVFAGPAINFLFAVFVLTILYAVQGRPVTPPVAGAVIVESAAAKAGFMPHDEIVAIDGKKISDFEDLRREVLVGLDTVRTFSILRDSETIKIVAAPEKLIEEDRFGFKHSRGMLGLISLGNALDVNHVLAIDGIEYKDPEALRKAIESRMDTVFTVTLDRGSEVSDLIVHPVRALNEGFFDSASPDYNYLNVSDRDEEVFVRYGILASIREAVSETANITMSTLEAMGQMITGTRSATELGGIIRIGAIAGDMAQSGFIALVTFTALLSINLGLINLFPIPMLDGGHLFFYAIEAAKGSPIPERIQEYAFRLGLALLIGIMLFANLNDIVQLVL